MIRHVRLELARCHDFPEGSSERGYTLLLPLTANGHLDREEWLHNPDRMHFERFWDGSDDHGWLKHDRGGWRLVFADAPEDDEAFFRGDDHRFVEGEYVTLRERDGEMHTFRVVSVR